MEPIIQRLKSKTYWAAIIGAGLSALEINSGLVSGLLPEGYRAWAVAFWPVLMITLREVTTTPLSAK